MTFDQAQSPRLGQRVPVESTYVRMFSGDEIPEAAWPGQIIYRNEEQILQIYNGLSWENVTGGVSGQLTFVGPVPPLAQHVGDIWFNSADNNRMYVAQSVGADAIVAGEWEIVSAQTPGLTATTHIYHQSTPPGPLDIPPPTDNDFWFETPINKQYYYLSTAPGTHWVAVRDAGIAQAVISTVTEYAINSSETVAPTTGWSTTAPVRTPGTYIWVRTTVTHGDGTTTTSAAALMTGNTGSTGDQGTPGVPGPPGSNGQALYTWIKYADSPTTGMSDLPTGKTYMGIAYNKTTPTESLVYSDYEWSSTQGPLGAQGVPGPPGPDGQPMFTWIKYATSAAGAGLNDSPVGMTYMGIAYNKTTAVESTNPALYEWSLIQGPQGSPGIQGPTGPAGQILYTWIKYADTPTTGMSDFPTGKPYMGIAYNKTSSTESNVYSDYEWSSTVGPQGSQGIPGPTGANGLPTYTWIKYGTSVAGAGLSDDPTGRPYLGIAYNKSTATESTNPTDYEWSLIQGPQGAQGPQGPQGSQGIQGPTGPAGQQLYTWIKYADTPTTGMSDFPTGKAYMGIAYNKTSATESSLYSDYEWSSTQGPTGSQGIQGPPGANGQPTYTWIKYATSVTGVGLSDDPTGRSYLGIAYNKSTATESTLPSDYEWSLIQGPQGIQGPAGSQGIQGPAGPNGQTLYTWIKYADTPTTGMSDLPAGKIYMGISYNNVSATESLTYSVYDWSLIQGPQGNTGIQGPIGPNGQPTYTWIKYADTVLGAGLSDLPAGKTYLGIAYNKTTAVESSITTDYEWSLIQGPQGPAGTPSPMIHLTSTTQVLTQPAAGGATTPATAVVTGTAVNTTIDKWEYSTDGGTTWATGLPTGVTRNGTAVTITGASMATTVGVRMSNTVNLATDTLTVAKVVNGATGSTGAPGADSYTVLLTNESHTFPGSTTAALAGSTVSQVIAYKAAVAMPATIGTITGQVTGLTTAITNNGTTTATVTVTVTTALVTLNGTLVIPITVDGVSFSKRFTWSISLTGTPGATGSTGSTGATGVSVTAITPYFAQVATGAAAPAQPAVATPLAPWVATEPAWLPNTELYRTEKVSYSNATFTYTTVTKVATYAAISVKAQTYYADGFTPNPAYDPALVPTDPAYQPPFLWNPLSGTFTIGDIWYQTDDDNRMYRWSGTAWLLVSDPNLPGVITSNEVYGEEISALGVQVDELSILATSADNTADTADGRVSMSDYDPGADDLFYVVTKPDVSTGLDVEYFVPRVNGSIWYTRTRPRKNLCLNPSLETNTTGWTGTATTILREVATFVPAGLYTLRVTNNATVTTHIVTWGSTTKVACSEGQIYTASAYAELISGSGLGTYMTILWFNAANALISTSTGTAVNLTLNAFQTTTLGTSAEPRLKVTGTAPALATSFYVRINAPAANINDVWHTGALLIELEDDLGRYFDGDSDDALWDGVAHASTSHLIGDKIYDIWELRDGDWIQKYLTSATISDLDASKLYGQVNGGIIQDATLEPDKLATVLVPASEALAAGDLVNIWSLDGDPRARKASASARLEAHGYVLEAVAVSSNAIVRHNGYNTATLGLTPGDQWLSATAGKISSTPPKTAGTLLQRVGHAPAETVLNFAPTDPIWIV